MCRAIPGVQPVDRDDTTKLVYYSQCSYSSPLTPGKRLLAQQLPLDNCELVPSYKSDGLWVYALKFSL